MSKPLPPPHHRATHSSCSSMMETPPWCPCGCAGRWRRGGASRGPRDAAEGPRTGRQRTSYLLRPLSVCCLLQKSFAGPGFPALTSDSAGRWPSLGSPREWPALASSGLEALAGVGRGVGVSRMEASVPLPLFFPNIFLCKRSGPSASLMGIKVLLLCDCLPSCGSYCVGSLLPPGEAGPPLSKAPASAASASARAVMRPTAQPA